MDQSLSVEEIEKSEVLWLRYEQRVVVQRDRFEKVKHSLNLIYNEHLLLRSKARYSDKLDTSRKLPLLLRSHSHFTNLVIRDAHEKVFHMVLIEL